MLESFRAEAAAHSSARSARSTSRTSSPPSSLPPIVAALPAPASSGRPPLSGRGAKKMLSGKPSGKLVMKDVGSGPSSDGTPKTQSDKSASDKSIDGEGKKKTCRQAQVSVSAVPVLPAKHQSTFRMEDNGDDVSLSRKSEGKRLAGARADAAVTPQPSSSTVTMQPSSSIAHDGSESSSGEFEREDATAYEDVGLGDIPSEIEVYMHRAHTGEFKNMSCWFLRGLFAPTTFFRRVFDSLSRKLRRAKEKLGIVRAEVRELRSQISKFQEEMKKVQDDLEEMSAKKTQLAEDISNLRSGFSRHLRNLVCAQPNTPSVDPFVQLLSIEDRMRLEKIPEIIDAYHRLEYITADDMKKIRMAAFREPILEMTPIIANKIHRYNLRDREGTGTVDNFLHEFDYEKEMGTDPLFVREVVEPYVQSTEEGGSYKELMADVFGRELPGIPHVDPRSFLPE